MSWQSDEKPAEKPADDCFFTKPGPPPRKPMGSLQLFLATQHPVQTLIIGANVHLFLFTWYVHASVLMPSPVTSLRTAPNLSWLLVGISCPTSPPACLLDVSLWIFSFCPQLNIANRKCWMLHTLPWASQPQQGQEAFYRAEAEGHQEQCSDTAQVRAVSTQ